MTTPITAGPRAVLRQRRDAPHHHEPGRAVIGVLLLWWSTTVELPWTVVLATLATVIVTIGVVNLVSAWFLQRSITDDLISLIQTDRRLIEAGVDRVDRVQDIDWIELLALDDQIEFFVLDVSQFRALVWPRVLDAAKSGLKTIEIVVVDVKQESARAELARRNAQTPDEIASSVSRLEADIEREWKAMKSASLSRCTLTVRRSAAVPSYAYAESSRVAAIVLAPLSSVTGLVESRVIVFRTERRGRKYADWITESSMALRATFTPPAYSDAELESGEL